MLDVDFLSMHVFLPALSDELLYFVAVESYQITGRDREKKLLPIIYCIFIYKNKNKNKKKKHKS
jgi:hypothetical protein